MWARPEQIGPRAESERELPHVGYDVWPEARIKVDAEDAPSALPHDPRGAAATGEEVDHREAHGRGG